MANYSTFIIKQILRYRWFIIALSVFIFLLSSLGLSRLFIDSDLRVFFSKDNPQLLQLEAVEKTYLKNENILMVIVPRQGSIFTTEVLTIIQELTDALWQTPASSRVDSITNFQHTRAEGDELIVEDLFEDIDDLSQSAIEYRKQVALNEPVLSVISLSRSILSKKHPRSLMPLPHMLAICAMSTVTGIRISNSI